MPPVAAAALSTAPCSASSVPTPRSAASVATSTQSAFTFTAAALTTTSIAAASIAPAPAAVSASTRLPTRRANRRPAAAATAAATPIATAPTATAAVSTTFATPTISTSSFAAAAGAATPAPAATVAAASVAALSSTTVSFAAAIVATARASGVRPPPPRLVPAAAWLPPRPACAARTAAAGAGVAHRTSELAGRVGRGGRDARNAGAAPRPGRLWRPDVRRAARHAPGASRQPHDRYRRHHHHPPLAARHRTAAASPYRPLRRRLRWRAALQRRASLEPTPGAAATSPLGAASDPAAHAATSTVAGNGAAGEPLPLHSSLRRIRRRMGRHRPHGAPSRQRRRRTKHQRRGCPPAAVGVSGVPAAAQPLPERGVLRAGRRWRRESCGSLVAAGRLRQRPCRARAADAAPLRRTRRVGGGRRGPLGQAELPPGRVSISAAESLAASAARSPAAVAAAVVASAGYASAASFTDASDAAAALHASANASSRLSASASSTSAAVGTAASLATQPVTTCTAGCPADTAGAAAAAAAAAAIAALSAPDTRRIDRLCRGDSPLGPRSRMRGFRCRSRRWARSS